MQFRGERVADSSGHRACSFEPKEGAVGRRCPVCVEGSGRCYLGGTVI